MISKQDDFSATLERTLDLDGKPAVQVQLEAPNSENNGSYWSCAYRILGLKRPVVRLAMGFDAIQALTLALCMVRADLEASAEAKAGRLTWLDGAEGFGFPDPKTHPDLPPLVP